MQKEQPTMTKNYCVYHTLWSKRYYKMINFLFPRICSWCGSSGSYLCQICKKQLHPHPEICPLTHRPSPWYAVRKDILTIPSPLDWCIVLFLFEPLIKKLILWLKYYHRRDISAFLGERLALALQSHEYLSQSLILNSQFLITYVPSHRIRKYITKWYNQSELLAQQLCKALWNQIPYKRICKKTKNTHSQVGMTKSERKNNLTNVFEMIEPITVWSIIIIVDDVLTSGATMIEMATTIKKSQPDCQVWGLCIARNG